MRRVLILLAAFLATAIAALAADPPPQGDDSDVSFEVEPPLLIPNRSDDPSRTDTETTPAATVDLAQLEKELERAKRNAFGAARLYKIGALAKVEVEQRALKVVRLESDLANARLAQAKEEVVLQESKIAAGETAKDELEATKAALVKATEAARTATAKREQAELDAAELNLQRQQKLLALGTARKSDVARAEQKLAALKAEKN